MDFSVESLETPALTKSQLADLLFEQIGRQVRDGFFETLTDCRGLTLD